MKTYYVIVDVEDKRLGAYVPAENVEGAFTTATARYKTRHPRLHVETIAVQEMTVRYVDPTFVSLRQALRPARVTSISKEKETEESSMEQGSAQSRITPC